MNRIPVRTNYEDRYFTDKWQTMPKNGYTVFFENMLDHANIEIELNSNFLEDRKYAGRFEKHFFTGRIDSYFRHLGLPELQYRSLHFEFETLDKEWHQKTATINYPNDFEYTRITEPKHSTDQKHQKTTIIREYPSWEGDPYYPVLNDGNKALYQKYETVAKEVQKDGVHFVGRLANYKYFNMDMAVANALNVYGEVEG
jgi:UDP-galactopyranose mutase